MALAIFHRFFQKQHFKNGGAIRVVATEGVADAYNIK